MEHKYQIINRLGRSYLHNRSASFDPSVNMTEPSLARPPLLYLFIASIPVAGQNFLPPLQRDRGGCGDVRVLSGVGYGVANLIVDIAFDHILLPSTHDRAPDPSVVRLGPQ